VPPKCTNLILELNNYAWEVKDGITLSTPIDAFNHLIDPLRYSVEKYITIREFKAAPSLY
jgi:phage terminase large subunit